MTLLVLTAKEPLGQPGRLHGGGCHHTGQSEEASGTSGLL